MTFQKTQTLDRLKKWEVRKTNQNTSSSLAEKKRLHLSNKFTRDQSDSIARRRHQQEQEEHERHTRMYEKVQLEKLNLANRHSSLANKTFSQGQMLLDVLQSRLTEADERKSYSIEKVKQRQSEHIEKVANTVEQAMLAEESRIEDARFRTVDGKVNFLQRLERQEKEKQDLMRHLVG